MPASHMTVHEPMTTGIVTISMDATLQHAQRIFNDRKFHHLIVVENGKPVGVLSDRDLLKNLSPFIGAQFSQRPQDLDTLKRRIHQVMTRRLISTEPQTPAIEAARLMMRHRVSCLPVIDSAGKLVGILTTRDLVRWAVIQEQTEPGP